MVRRTIIRSTAAVLFMGYSSVLLASPAQEEFDPFALSLSELADVAIVTIATGLPTALAESPAVTSIITAEEIQAMGATHLDEVLERIPGLHVAPSDVLLSPLYSFRGIHTDQNPQVLMLVDGRKVHNTSNDARPRQFKLPITMISRIEVIRGPGSAVYGADAFAGVINIITKSPEDVKGTQYGMRLGSFKTREAWLQTGGKLAGFATALTMEWHETAGDRDRTISSDLQTTLDGINGSNASLAPGSLNTRYHLANMHLTLQKENWELKLWHWKNYDVGTGQGVAKALDPEGSWNQKLLRANLTYQNSDLWDDWDLTAHLDFQYFRGEAKPWILFPAGTILAIGTDGNVGGTAPTGLVTFTDGYIGNPVTKQRVSSFETVGVYKGFDNHRVRLAAGLEYQDSNHFATQNFGPGIIDGTVSPIDGTLTAANSNSVYLPDVIRKVWHGSVQDEWAFTNDWSLTSGLRLDYISDVGATLNPRTALVWKTRPDLTSKLLYAHAFRAPSLNELYTMNNPVSIGNPSVEPETIRTLELAFNYQPTPALSMDLNLYGYRAKDLIEHVQDSGATTKTYQNARDQNGHGLEWEGRWQLREDFQLTANYAWQHSEDAQSGARIAAAPGMQGFVGATWDFKTHWKLYTELHWIGDRARDTDDSRPEMKDTLLVNLALKRVKIMKALDFGLLIRNVFNHRYYEPSDGVIADDYPMPSRSIMLELKYHWDASQ
ncbi:TonB-dependent receptor plug domain-containing protein [Magnetococcus sp. PR-3]|uniref:TonB-dependent receptor plug domain-containing protein n=1 Tax=Magnetococcus sp. PR-3 TaxID=3120355 RepID=UPI002FCE5392